MNKRKVLVEILDTVFEHDIDLNKLGHYSPSRVQIIGFLLEDRTDVLLVGTFVDKEQSDVYIIPKSAVVCVRELELKKTVNESGSV